MGSTGAGAPPDMWQSSDADLAYMLDELENRAVENNWDVVDHQPAANPASASHNNQLVNHGRPFASFAQDPSPNNASNVTQPVPAYNQQGTGTMTAAMTPYAPFNNYLSNNTLFPVETAPNGYIGQAGQGQYYQPSSFDAFNGEGHNPNGYSYSGDISRSSGRKRDREDDKDEDELPSPQRRH